MNKLLTLLVLVLTLSACNYLDNATGNTEEPVLIEVTEEAPEDNGQQEGQALELAPAPETTQEAVIVSPTGPTTREETDLLLFGRDTNGDVYDILVQIGTESWEHPTRTGVTIGGYQFNTGNQSFTYTFVLPVGWFGTLHLAGRDKAELYIGDGTTSFTAWRATFRNPANYPIDDIVNTDPTGCSLLEAENLNGVSQDWQFTLLAGNIVCENAPQSSVENNLAANRTDLVPANCPVIEGNATVAGNDGAPFCNLTLQSTITFVVPSGWQAEWWDGSPRFSQAGESVTTNVVTFRPVR